MIQDRLARIESADWHKPNRITPTLTVIIPTKDEAQTISRVIDEVRPFVDEILIVDGWSNDGTFEIASRQECVKVFRDDRRGKGSAMRQGLAQANGDIVVFMDADGSHVAHDIERLVEPIVKDEADMVIGCRMRGGSDEFAGSWTLFVRLWGNNMLTVLINMRHSVRLTDSQNGFRAARTALLRQLDLKENRHTLELEMILKALKTGCRVAQIPSHEYQRQYGSSKLSVREQLIPFAICLLRNIW